MADKRYIAINIILFLCIAGVMLLDPIAQNIEYHQFKDQKTFFNIPNFWNVITNLPFLMVGLYGLYSILYTQKLKFIPELKTAYVLFFASVSLVSFGSGYYHLSPDNETLLWDRLPMSFSFMAFISIMIAEFISLRLSKILLWPLVAFGVFSVFYWRYTESVGEGDLRLYILVQFLTILLIPVILLLFRSRFTNVSGYGYLLGAYIVAKLSEYLDVVVDNNLMLLSGHSMKHLFAALGIFILLKSYNNRENTVS